MIATASELVVVLTKRAQEAARAAVKAVVEASREAAKILRPVARESLRLVKEIPEGRMRLSLFEHEGSDGKVKGFWTLDRETVRGRQRLGHGSLKELLDTRKVFQEVAEFVQEKRQGHARERERRDRRERWPVVSRVRLTPDGVRARIEATFPSQIDAELAAKGSPRIAWHEPLRYTPKEGEVLTARVDREAGRIAGNARLESKRQELIWTSETRGPFHTLGRWYDRDSVPEAGDRVRVAVSEYRRVPDDHRITPDRQLKNPGEPDRPLFVLVDNATDTVKAISTDRAGLVVVKLGLDERAGAIRQATDNRLWQEVTFSPGLRRHSNVVTTRTFVRERTRADVIERIGEDGERTTTVLLSRAIREADGRIRTIGRAYDLDELRQLGRVLEGSRRAVKPRQEPTRPAKPGPQPYQESLPLQERVKRPSPDPRPRGEIEARDEPEKGTKPEAKIVVGVWDDAARPRKKGQWVTFPLGAAGPEQRPIVPGHAPTGPAQGRRPRYVLVEVIVTRFGFGVGRIHGTTPDRDRAVKHAEILNHRAEGKQRHLGRTQQEKEGRHRQDAGRGERGPGQAPEQGHSPGR